MQHTYQSHNNVACVIPTDRCVAYNPWAGGDFGGSMVGLQSRARLPKSVVVIMDVGSNPTQGNFCITISNTHYTELKRKQKSHKVKKK